MRKETEVQKAVREVQPYGGLLADIIQVASRYAKETNKLLGPANKIERAGDIHRGTRTGLECLCAMENCPMVLREGNRSPDHLVFRGAFALRWGHRIGKRISRNDSNPTRQMHEQGLLSWNESSESAVAAGGTGIEWGVEKTLGDLLLLTVSYTFEDDFTLANKAQWYVGQVDLVQELAGDIEFLCSPFATFSAPKKEIWTDDPKAIVRARQGDEERWAKELNRIRRAG